MYTIGTAFYHLKNLLHPLYNEREAAAIAHIVMEHITGMGKLERLANKDNLLAAKALYEFTQAVSLLQKGVPVQYVTGKAWFAGSEYMVNPHVLIPRPETEELVQWIATDNSNRQNGLKILDIGTGSGCIPISIKKLLPHASVTSCDISKEALEVAAQNAANLDADITLLHLDFLNESQRAALGTFDIIVSNPPYIPLAEKENLHTNVREHEPHLALFVPNEDALIFYRVIAQFGLTHLAENGGIYCELDANHALQTKQLFESTGYANVQLQKDIHSNDRMLRAQKVSL